MTPPPLLKPLPAAVPLMEPADQRHDHDRDDGDTEDQPAHGRDVRREVAPVLIRPVVGSEAVCARAAKGATRPRKAKSASNFAMM
jgi:hypothetical protein